jgi:hypothetical protein
VAGALLWARWVGDERLPEDGADPEEEAGAAAAAAAADGADAGPGMRLKAA